MKKRVVWINYGLAQISRAFGQGAKSPTRAVAALLARVKIYYNPHPYGLDSLWFGSIVTWIHCGLDQCRNLRNLQPKTQSYFIAAKGGMCLTINVVQLWTIEQIVQLLLLTLLLAADLHRL